MRRLIEDMVTQANRLRNQQALYRLAGEPHMVYATREAAITLERAVVALAAHEFILAENTREALLV